MNLHSPSATQRLAARLGKLLQPGDVIELSGPLGAGKTCFVQGLARGLGVARTTRITSPTFNIVLEYPARLPLVHIDLYRIADATELIELGFDHYLESGAVCAIEWLERFPEAAPPHRLSLQFAIEGPKRRTLSVVGHGRCKKLITQWLGGQP